MNQLTKSLVEGILGEEKKEVVALYAGGFKPPTAGHFLVVEEALKQYPEIDKLIVLVGSGTRDGIEQTESILVWEIYQNYLPMKVEIQAATKPPIGAVYSYASDNPEETIYWILGAREDNEEDLSDIAKRTAAIDKKEDKYSNVEVKIIRTANKGMSGTNARKALRDGDQETFSKFIPTQVKEKDEIFNILRPAVVENLDEGRKKKKDPKVGTGKKPKGSSRRLYTDEDPTDTVKVKFSSRQDIVDTLNKKSFKAKSHARQSQIINLIHQRVRAAYNRAKDPDVKKRLKTALDYAEQRKEASKKKTQRLKKQKLKEDILKQTDFILQRGVKTILQAEEDDYNRGLKVELSDEGGYIVNYWYGDDAQVYPVEVEIDGESVKPDAKEIYIKFHPYLEKDNINERFSKEIIDKYRNKPESQIPFSVRNYMKAKGIIKSKSTDESKGGGRGNVGTRYRAIYKKDGKFYYDQDDPLGQGIRQTYGPYKTKDAAIRKMNTFAPAVNYRDLTEYVLKVINEKLCKRGYNYIAKRKREGEKHNPFLTARAVKVCKGQIKGSDGKQKKDFRPKKGKKRSAQGRKPDIIKEIGIDLSNYDGQILPGDVLRAPKGFPLGGKKLEKSLALKVIKNSREGVNRYKLTLEDPKTGKKYSVRNYEMDGEYQGKKLPQWGLIRKSKKNINEEKTTHTVIAKGIVFEPKNITINVGDTVKFINKEGYHNVNGTKEAYPKNPEGFGNKVGAGWTYNFTFTKPGLYKYHCDPHRTADMGGTIKVENKINEDINFKSLEKQLDDMFAELDIDVAFTNHFKERVIERGLTEEDIIELANKIIDKYPNELDFLDKDQNIVMSHLSRLVDIAAVNTGYGDDYLKDLVFKTAFKRKDKSEPEFRTNKSSPRLSVNENAMKNKIDILPKIGELTLYMLEKGMNIEPLPTLEIIEDDVTNAEDFLGKTAYYDPNKKHIVLYTYGRHPKDIVRSYAHEMIHHIQNLEGRLGNVTTTNTLKDDYLNKLEAEANLKGTMTFRNYTDSLNEIGDASQKPYKWTKSESSRFPGTINYDFVTDKDTEYQAYFVPTSPGFYEFGFSAEDGDLSATINKGELFRVMSTIVDIMKDFITTTPWDRIEFEGSKDFERVEKGIEDKRRDKLYRAYLKKNLSNFPNIDVFVQGGVTYLYNEDEDSLTEYDNSGPSIPKVYVVKDDGTYKEAPIELLSKISNLTYDMGGGETNYYPEKNIVIVDNIPIEKFSKNPGEIKGGKIYVEYNLNNPTSLPKANKIIASQLVYHLDDHESFAQTVANSLKDGGTFDFQSDLMNKKDKTFLQHLSDEYGFGLPTKLNQYKQQSLPLKKGEFVEPVISYTYKITDKDGKTSTLSITKKGNSWEWKKIDGNIDFKTGEWSKPPEDPDPNFRDKKYTLRAFDKYLEYYGDSNTIVDFERLNEDGQKISDKNMDDYKKSNNPSGKVKDPFGLNAFARELAIGLEEEIINEGRYDKLVNQLSKIAFETIKDGYDIGRKVVDLEFSVGPDDEDIFSNDFEFDFNIQAEYTEDEYKVDGGANAGFDDKGEEITPLLNVRFKIPKNIDFQEVSFDLKDVIRHELEHLTQDGPNVRPGKQMADDQFIRKMIDSDTLSQADYFKLEKEIDAMLQGLYFKAKKSKRPFIEVIDDYLDKQPLTQEEREDILDLWRKRNKALSLPLFENEEEVVDYRIFLDMDGVLVDFDQQFKDLTGMMPREFESKYSTEEFWGAIDKAGVGFWRGMDWMPGGEALYNRAAQYDHFLLSSPSRSEISKIGKRLWRRDNTPNTKLYLARSYNKRKFAAPNHILIDDRADNVQQWKDAGGIGILYKSADQVNKELDKLGL